MATFTIEIQPGDIVQDYLGSQGMVERVYQDFEETPLNLSMTKEEWLRVQFPAITEQELNGFWAHVVMYTGGTMLAPVTRFLKCKTENGLARPYLPIQN